MSLPSQQIGHLLFELDQLHGQSVTRRGDADQLQAACRRIARQIRQHCNEQERARLMRMSRAYRHLNLVSR